jgi:hypothetical protein
MNKTKMCRRIKKLTKKVTWLAQQLNEDKLAEQSDDALWQREFGNASLERDVKNDFSGY